MRAARQPVRSPDLSNVGQLAASRAHGPLLVRVAKAECSHLSLAAAQNTPVGMHSSRHERVLLDQPTRAGNLRVRRPVGVSRR